MSRSRGSTDHPRSRGVYHRALLSRFTKFGSSPLARGLRAMKGSLGGKIWIIPARAGFTLARRRKLSHPPDHPRSRGVYVKDLAVMTTCIGSSPLARGLLARRIKPRGPTGIIPARAGFTSIRSNRASTSRDHPRSRGVYQMAAMRASASKGSSPLARGLRGAGPRQGREAGIIPARAGFTFSTHHGGRLASDHPRSRGVYLG